MRIVEAAVEAIPTGGRARRPLQLPGPPARSPATPSGCTRSPEPALQRGQVHPARRPGVGLARGGVRAVTLTVSDTGQGIRPDFLPHASSGFARRTRPPPVPTAGSGSAWPSCDTWSSSTGAPSRPAVPARARAPPSPSSCPCRCRSRSTGWRPRHRRRLPAWTSPGSASWSSTTSRTPANCWPPPSRRTGRGGPAPGCRGDPPRLRPPTGPTSWSPTWRCLAWTAAR